MNVLISWQSVRQLLFQIISVWQSADQLTHDVFPKAATNMLTGKSSTVLLVYLNHRVLILQESVSTLCVFKPLKPPDL